MNFKQTAVSVLTVACLIGAAMLLPDISQAQDPKVKTAMELLESTANKLVHQGSKGLMQSLVRRCPPFILVQPR